ncbi:lysophospholipid acyltransferase family protein [Flavobacterium selenitireducens]|uniref:lysophospholipid acyltransferase family protein n=1 Tax=Flavobacterium selenitireducens TaxID=2722704 RepID=UPI00168B82FC|nr:lysophospholipid acyltransferase family protein [Flavobacterium selenitireducens]MBD3583045.1 lysophospholipid acyltransferase family protein [Flavobacterium selenitireducens]
MQLLLFWLVYPALLLISILPFRLLFALSDGVYFLVYRIAGYRKKTVRRNLKMAFPNLSDKERKAIEIKFYHHLCDMFLEMIKTMSMSHAEMEKHFRFTNPELFLEMQAKGKSIMMYASHYGTYEWIISVNYHTDNPGFAVYKRIRNVHFDKLVRKIRSRFKAHLITTKETVPTIIHNRAAGISTVYGLVSDQSPKASSIQHWTTFMGIETPVHIGAELLAKRYDMIAMNLRVESVKRGYYECTYEVLAENPRDVPNFQISEDFMNRLEKQIRKAPELYLWTHKRWKHRRENFK